MRSMLFVLTALSACGDGGPLDCEIYDDRPDFACDVPEGGSCAEYNWGDEPEADIEANLADCRAEDGEVVVDACPHVGAIGQPGDGTAGGCTRRLGTTGCFTSWLDGEFYVAQAETECRTQGGYWRNPSPQ